MKARSAGTHARQVTVHGQRSHYSDSVIQEQLVRGSKADQEMVEAKAEKSYRGQDQKSSCIQTKSEAWWTR